MKTIIPVIQLQNISTYRRAHREAGVTLIELMIAIFITLFLIAGMLGIVVSLRGSFITQDQLQRMQENQRFALSVLDNTVRSAGFYTNQTTTTPQLEFTAVAAANGGGTSFAAGQTVAGFTGGVGASDTLNIRFQGDPSLGMLNCLGDSATSGTRPIWINSFTINSSNQLTCAVGTNGAALGAATVLVNNVASMGVLYGIETAAGSTFAYVPSTSVDGTTYQWGNVKSIQVRLNFQDLINARTGTPVALATLTHTINLMNKN